MIPKSVEENGKLQLEKLGAAVAQKLSESTETAGYVRVGWFVYLDGIIWSFFADKTYALIRREELMACGGEDVEIKEAFEQSR